MNPTRVLSRRGFAVALLFGLLVLPIRALPAGSPAAALLISEVRYEGQLGDAEARFTATIVGEVLGKGEVSALLFEGDLAVLPVQLPSHLRLARQGNQYRLVAIRVLRQRHRQNHQGRSVESGHVHGPGGGLGLAGGFGG